MRYTKVTIFVDGECIVEPNVPLFFVPLLRWMCRRLGASIVCAPVPDSKGVG